MRVPTLLLPHRATRYPHLGETGRGSVHDEKGERIRCKVKLRQSRGRSAGAGATGAQPRTVEGTHTSATIASNAALQPLDLIVWRGYRFRVSSVAAGGDAYGAPFVTATATVEA